MSLKKIRLSFFSGSRSEFDIISNVIEKAQNINEFETTLIVSGNHLKKIRKNKIKKIFKINLAKKDNTKETYYSSVISEVIIKITNKLKYLRPDFLILHGDRFETLAAAIASSSMNIPTVQLEAGDITNGGTYDDSVRHAISRLSHILFATNQESKKRLIKFGEEEWRIKNFGLSSFDKMHDTNFATTNEIKNKFQISLNKPIILFTFHPSSIDYKKTYSNLKICLKSLDKFKKNVDIIITYPNNDLGSKIIIDEYKKNNKFKIYESLGKHFYYGLMSLNLKKVQKVICAGNSSSGIKETPFFHCPTINIGNRQDGRLQANNVVNVKLNEKLIDNAIKATLKNNKFNIKNPYYIENSSIKILKFIKKFKNKKFELLNKKYK
jgi:UDP-hydrolysing UDP-N-acetyl-D-glucosamine 2-epimerase